MKNLATVLVLLLLVTLAMLLWRLEERLAPMAELARTQLADRAELRQTEQTRIVTAEKARMDAAQQELQAAAAAQQREREALARRARLELPVKPGEVVSEIYLDNHSTVRDAVVVSVQGTSVSFKVGARLYNIPTEQLPGELQTRVRNQFPLPPASVTEPASAPVSPTAQP